MEHGSGGVLNVNYCLFAFGNLNNAKVFPHEECELELEKTDSLILLMCGIEEKKSTDMTSQYCLLLLLPSLSSLSVQCTQYLDEILYVSTVLNSTHGKVE